MSHTAAACPDLHGDLDNLGVSLTTRYELALQAILVKQSSAEIRKQIKEESHESRSPQLINADLLYTSPRKLTIYSEYLCSSGEVADWVYKPVYDAGQIINDSICTEAGNETD